jgi:uncharacterized protein (DUF2147 family)
MKNFKFLTGRNRVMKQSIIVASLILMTIFSFDAFAIEVKSDDILGIWLIEENGESVEKIEIYKKGDSYFGKIKWLKAQDESDGVVVDRKNRSDELKTRPLLGLEFMIDFKFDGKDSWSDGKLYAYRKGRTVSPKFTLIDENHLNIQVKILFIKKSFSWIRVTTIEDTKEEKCAKQ